MTEHTPGAWTVRHSDGTIERWWVDAPVGLRPNVTDEQIGPPIANVYEKANARLIAAAPELLEALEYAVQHIAVLQQRGTPSGPVAIPSIINDAIAKAKGQ